MIDYLNYSKEFPNWPPLHFNNGFVYGVWMIGNNYQSKNKYYGEYPPTYLKRIHSIFNSKVKMLHLFSGKVEKGFWKTEHTLDINPDLNPDILSNAEKMSENVNYKYDLILADPPYSHSDAKKYGYKLSNKKKVLHECFKILEEKGHIVWLDTSFPMYSKKEFKLVGTIGIIRSTNHRTRMVFIFEKAT